MEAKRQKELIKVSLKNYWKRYKKYKNTLFEKKKQTKKKKKKKKEHKKKKKKKKKKTDEALLKKLGVTNIKIHFSKKTDETQNEKNTK